MSRMGEKKVSNPSVREGEYELEKLVSNYIRELPFLWIEVDDPPSKISDRAKIEKNAIALVSNYNKSQIDPRRDTWLGKYCLKDEIQKSGLWNSNYVKEKYDKAFLELFEKYIKKMS